MVASLTSAFREYGSYIKPALYAAGAGLLAYNIGFQDAALLGGTALLTISVARDILHGRFGQALCKLTLGGLLTGAAINIGARAEPVVTENADRSLLLADQDYRIVPENADQCSLLLADQGCRIGAIQKVRPPIQRELLPQRYQGHIEYVEKEGRELVEEVNEVLEEGGRVERADSFSGVYKIKTAKGSGERTVAVFKPRNERVWGPENPLEDRRGSDLSEEDIEFGEVDSIGQGNPDVRNSLALMLDDRDLAPLPPGTLVRMASDQFVDLDHPDGAHKKTVLKEGFLQKWMGSDGPLLHAHPEVERHFSENPHHPLSGKFWTRFDVPLLDEIPLEEFQKIGIQNIILYNQDGHIGNYLVRRSGNGPHLFPIDMDAILPFRLENLISISENPRAFEQFAQRALGYIEHLEPQVVEQIARDLGFSRQACLNIRALATTAQAFGRAGLTLGHIHQFVTNVEHRRQPSQLWELMTQAHEEAVNRLPEYERTAYLNYQGARRQLWRGEESRGLRDTVRYYRANQQEVVERHLVNAFWDNFNRLLNQAVAQIS